MMWANAAHADYKLGSGDTIEISVFGRTDLTRRAMIDPDGKIQVPLIGEVAASGLTMSELRARIKDLMATSDLVRGGDVLVDIIEHRPFYVYGNVTRGGSYPYRPGMTVRHALALAGGFETIRSQGNTTPVASAELRGRYRTLSADYAKQQVRVASLRAESEGKSELDLSALPRSARSQRVIAELIDLETQQLKAIQDQREKEKKYLATALQLADAQVGALDRGQKVDEEASKAAIGRARTRCRSDKTWSRLNGSDHRRAAGDGPDAKSGDGYGRPPCAGEAGTRGDGAPGRESR